MLDNRPDSWTARPLPRKFAVRLQMSVLFLAGVVVMIIHDRYCMALHNKPSRFFGQLRDFHLDNWFTTIGNIIAMVARAILSGAIALVFAQVFWMRMRRRNFTVRQVDVVMTVIDHPLGMSTFSSLRHSWALSIIALLGATMGVVSIFAPGSIKIALGGYDSICDRTTVDLGGASIGAFRQDGDSYTYLNPSAQAKSLASRVILGNKYLPPSEALFDGDTRNIIYNVTFDAPFFTCADITDSAYLASVLPDPPSSNGTVVVWNSSYVFNEDGMLLRVASRQLFPDGGTKDGVVPGPAQAVECHANVSSYVVLINEGEGPTTYEFPMIKPVSPVFNGTTSHIQDIEFAALTEAFTLCLNGTATYDRDFFQFTPDSSVISNSPLGAADGNSPWSWGPNLTLGGMTQSLMASVSASVLSNVLTQTDGPSVKEIQVACNVFDSLYIYDRSRLFLVYGAALLVTALCILVGFVAIHVNGEEESVEFSRILREFVEGRAPEVGYDRF